MLMPAQLRERRAVCAGARPAATANARWGASFICQPGKPQDRTCNTSMISGRHSTSNALQFRLSEIRIMALDPKWRKGGRIDHPGLQEIRFTPRPVQWVSGILGLLGVLGFLYY